MSRALGVGKLVVSVIELFASVALPEIALPSFRVLDPFPIERATTRTATRLFELPSDRVIPVLREPYRFSLPYDPS